MTEITAEEVVEALENLVRKYDAFVRVKKKRELNMRGHISKLYYEIAESRKPNAKKRKMVTRK